MDDLLPPCPADMQGPISHCRMVDPVVASDGFTYERSDIEQWLGNGNRASPMTRNKMNVLPKVLRIALKGAQNARSKRNRRH